MADHSRDGPFFKGTNRALCQSPSLTVMMTIAPVASILTIHSTTRRGSIAMNATLVRAYRRLVSSVTLLIALPLFLAPLPAHSQALGINPVIGGVPLSCRGIPAFVSPINDLARAQPGAIFLNPALFNLPADVQIFVYAHECAHQVFSLDETAADCWAVQLGRDQGWLDESGVNRVAFFFRGSRGDWTHKPGPERIRDIVSCFAN